MQKQQFNYINNPIKRVNKHQISRTMGPSTPVQELLTPIDMQKLEENQMNQNSGYEPSSQRGKHLENSQNIADQILAQSLKNMNHSVSTGINVSNYLKSQNEKKSSHKGVKHAKPPR